MTKFFNKYFSNIRYFYTQLGKRLFVAFSLSFGVALMDGLGLAMFIPLLQTVDGGESNVEVLGNLSFLAKGLVYLGVPLNLIGVLGVILVFFVIKGVFKFLEGYYKTQLQYSFIKKLRFDLIDSLAGYEYGSFVKSDSGKVQNTISGEVNRVIMAYRSYFLTAQAGIMVIVYLGLAFSVNAQFTVLVIGGGLITNRVFKRIFDSTKKYSRKLSEEGHHFQGLLIQMAAFFKYLKATAGNQDYKEKLKSKVQNLENSQRRIGINNAVIDAIREPIIIVIVVVVILIEFFILGGSISIIILSLLFFYRALSYVISFQGHWNNFLANYGALENIQEFSNELHGKQETISGKEFQEFNDNIKFDKVHFGYEGKKVLKNISFSIQKNQTVALIGESGSGKSTIMNLLTGIITPQNGQLLFDGESIEKFNVLSLRKKIGYITQEPVIFDDTIYNNVTFWAENSPKNELRFWNALEQASIADFVRNLPEREHSRMGSNGILVSGGQKQRISIARELYKEVELMLMDEATSSLDSDTEKSIQENIELLKGKYTIVIIAHRLATIKNSDKIILVSNGEIVDADHFNGLMESSPIFKKMVMLQEF